MVSSAVVAGFGAGLSLIVAIGAQNAFVLRQGLRKEHVGAIVAVCVASDILLICAGTGGLDQIGRAASWALPVMRWLGVGFLLVYGAISLSRAWKDQSLVDQSERTGASRWSIVLTAVALTWLNPHVYLDTVLLLGSLAVSHRPSQWWFAVGAMCASCVWFPVLGYGARWLRPLFASPRAWRVLDVVIAVVMWGIAASLIW
ncbi:MAG: LysE/ArgO family amino acid transporter [Propionibacteriaceae bacterium]|nr:LysE/ArgO family amino acid transporter [Propionibacteriaceae bacterium]